MNIVINENYETDGDKNAWLCFENNKKIAVKAVGRTGTFSGYLTFVDGNFFVSELHENSDERQIFVTDNVNITIGELQKNKHIICMAENFNDIKNNEKSDSILKNATFVTDFQPELISCLLDDSNEYKTFNNIKCILHFPSNEEKNDKDIFEKINSKISNMPDHFYDIDFLKEHKQHLPHNIAEMKPDKNNNFDKLDILNNTKNRCKIAVIDFGISSIMKKILQKYFTVTILPYEETCERIGYLYYDNKIDGVVISDSMSDTKFVKDEVKREILKLINNDAPLLGIEFGSLLIAELLDSETQNQNTCFHYNNFCIKNFDNKVLKVSRQYYKQITKLSTQLKTEYLDGKANIVGFRCYEKNILGYNFSFCEDNPDTAYLLNEFFKIMKHKNKL